MAQALDVVAKMVSPEFTAESLPWHLLRYQHAQALRTALAERYAPATANKMLAALRGVLREAWRLGWTNAEDYQRASDLASVRGETLPAGRHLSAGELRALFVTCAEDPSAAGRRDAAILALFYGGGLRRSEVVSLNVGDFNPETGELRIRTGKGRKARIVYAANGAEDALKAWLDIYPSGPMFPRIRKGGRIVSRRMTAEGVYQMLLRRGEEADVNHFSPHDLRRTFVSDLLDSTGDVSAVRALAGHARVETTLRYDRRGEAAKKKAAELIHVPFVRRKK